jgi:hypothetical protein
VDYGEACESRHVAGGGWSTVVDGDPCRRRRQCGELAHPASLAGGLSSNPVLEKEAMTTNLSLGLDGDEGERRWPATGSRDDGGGRAEKRQKQA